ncbi:MAG: CAP domain-containing protein [Herpetosiphonaceae bacterium]|nr:CAP domain-containing protein [Herpetosiphonaceae bacterium]
MPRRIITLCMLCLLCLSAIVRPTPTLAAGQQFFSETGHTVSGRFLDYWQQNGGLAQFGLPISEPISEQNADTGKTYTVQYFERNRFEYHPDQTPPYDVLLGRLGVTSLEHRGLNWHSFAGPSQPNSGCQYFAETSHSLCQPFLGYWQSHGGLPLFGFPVSEMHSETSPTDGKTYTVQYFERNRFEYHPENAAPYNVLLGLLGTELYGKQAPAPQPVVDATLQHALDLINAQRGGAGLAPLRVSSTLMTIAQSYSQVQAQQASISHTGPDGANPGQRLDRSGYKWAAYGENLAAGQSSADAVVTSWMNSPEHRANILNSTFRDVGVGLTHRSGDPSHFFDYWVLELGAPQ